MTPSQPVALAAGQLGAIGAGQLGGITVRETAAAAATVKLYDGTAGSGTLLLTLALAASGSAFLVWPRSVRYKTGVFAVITGTIEGSIFID